MYNARGYALMNNQILHMTMQNQVISTWDAYVARTMSNGDVMSFKVGTPCSSSAMAVAMAELHIKEQQQDEGVGDRRYNQTCSITLGECFERGTN